MQELKGRVLHGLVRSMPQFAYDPQKRFRGYLTNAIGNTIKSYRQELTKRPGLVGGGGSWDQQSPDELAEDVNALSSEIEGHLLHTIALLEQTFAQIQAVVEPGVWESFHQTAVMGKSAPEVAKATGRSLSAVYMAKKRVLDAIRSALVQKKVVLKDEESEHLP